MDGCYLEYQGHVHVGATLSSNMLLNAKKETSLHYVTTDRSSRPGVFLRKVILKLCRKFTGEHLCRSAISMKLCFALMAASKQTKNQHCQPTKRSLS